MSPDESQLRVDLEATNFQVGVDAGMWDLVELTWPWVVFTITAADGKLAMRLNFEGYPGIAPAGQPWDVEAHAALAVQKWPTGGSAELTFRRDWSPSNQNAPYLAADRRGLATHPPWITDLPDRAWNPSRTVDFYLAEIYRNLRASVIPSES